MSVVIFGTLAFDTVQTPYGKMENVLGGSGTFAACSASYFTDCGVVGIVGEDFAEEHFEILRGHNIDCAGVEKAPGKTFHWEGKYDDDMNDRETIATELNTLDGYMPKVPQEYRGWDYIILANNDPQMQIHALEQMQKPKLVVCDTMNLWIDIKNEALTRLIGMIDILILNDGEARQYTGEYNLIKAAKIISAKGPGTVVIKKGEHGALLFKGDDFFALPGYPLEQVMDPTGAGDTFAGGFVGYLAKTGDAGWDSLKKAMVYGSVMASFNVEKFSLDGLTGLGMEQIDQRYQDFQKQTAF